MSLRRADHSSRGVLPTVVRRRSRNLKNEETMARVGPQHHKIKKLCVKLILFKINGDKGTRQRRVRVNRPFMNMQVSTKERVLQVQKETNCGVTLELKIYSCCCFCCMEQTKLVKQIHRPDINCLYSFPNIFPLQ